MKPFINTFKSFICLYICSSGLQTSAENIPIAGTAYDYKTIQRENLDRGLIAIRSDSSTVAVTWRYLETDPENVAFNVYRNGEKINTTPISDTTIFYDNNPDNNMMSKYEVRVSGMPESNGNNFAAYTLDANSPIGYLSIPLDIPAPGVTPAGEEYTYNANDASIGDVDGDGRYEIILKWEPSNAHDNSHDGYTGNVLFDCYTLDGEKLWRIDLGKNIRAGAHYTQFMVYDFDGNGRAEIIMKTGDGTIDGMGNVIGDKTADYREKGESQIGDYPRPKKPRGYSEGPIPKDNLKRWKAPLKNQGRILTGPEYLTIFEGATGKALATIDYVPERGDLEAWGDNRANRSDRFLAGIAYLDGVHPSAVMCRGYYTRSVIAAFDWDGQRLSTRWVFDSDNPGCEAYAGQGNHNLRVADIDGDGCDEIIYGQCAIDNDGTGLYSTGMGHGDAIHLTAFFPGSDSLQVWACHENKRDGSTFRDALTGKVIFQIPNTVDVGRCLAADIDPTNPGLEMWSSDAKTRRGEDGSYGVRNVKGEIVPANLKTISINSAVWWDGDLLRELLDKNSVTKFDWNTRQCKTLQEFEGAVSNNGTKANACLSGDIIGDWREEVLLRTPDNSELRLYVSALPTQYRFHTFLHDIPYRISIATQNVAYNQPTQPGFYFGSDLEKGKCIRGSIIK